MTFQTDVKFYQQLAKSLPKTTLLFLDPENKEAFYALAPLSKAIHALGKDLYVTSSEHTYVQLMKVYDAYESKEKELLQFIAAVEKKLQKSLKGSFKALFQRPAVIHVTPEGFLYDGFVWFFKHSWLDDPRYKKLKKSHWKKLKETGTIIWEQVFNLRKNEKTAITFELIPKNHNAPLQDLLDNFLIAQAMYQSAQQLTKRISLGASTSRDSVLALPEAVSELLATLNGCLYEQAINEPIFKLFKKIAANLSLSLEVASAVFGIYGDGYHGRHLFGEAIGYPTLNKKSRWSSPGQMFFKFSWYPQALEEERDPLARVGFTSTVPVEDFVLTNHIDWFAMAKRNQQIKTIFDECEEIHVEGKHTNFVVGLVNQKTKQRRRVMRSDVDIRDKYDKEFYKEHKVKTGTMANLPGGEAFVTPEWITGRAVGDVVISIDDSYVLNERQPLVIDFKDGFYTIVRGPKKVLQKIKEKKKEAWQRLLEQEKNKSLPKKIIDLKKKNFERVGEFAINTNPKAKLSRYLIINEKIANMIHIALGSGFEADRATEYHWDMVINAKKQKLDIYGVKRKGKKEEKIYILKQGKFVV